MRGNPSLPDRIRLAARLALVLASPSLACGATLTVGPGESIVAALQRASPGDTVLLTGREYREHVVIDVPVTLRGVDHPRILGGYEGHVVHVRAPGTVLEGLHVAQSGTQLTRDLACVLVEADDVVIRDNVITEPLHGIYVKAANRVVIEGNRIEGRLDLVEEDRGNGIHLWNSEGNRITGNEISNVRDGMYFSFANSTIVERNVVHHVRYGLHYMYSDHNVFRDNMFENNVAGAALMYSEDIHFSRNVFARCRGFRAYGVLFQSMDDIVATENLILDNSRGVFMNNAGQILMEGNDIADNDLAVQLNGGCDGIRFVGNNFLNNLSELLLDVSDMDTQWADSERGNYWSRYRGYDLDRDGIGDVPHQIQNAFQSLEASAPGVRFYVLSPAAKILEIAERALPILVQGDAVDPRPLLRPAANSGVPWERAATMTLEPSPWAAGAYLLLTLLPYGILVYASRVPARLRRRRSTGKSA